jgi:flagellar biosynthesis component FlhA
MRNFFTLVFRAVSGVGAQGLIVSIIVLSLIALLLVPLPTPILDVLIVVNIVIALILLLTSLFGQRSDNLFFFPTILLLTTLFRLALNVSSTRLILLNGEQGLRAAGRVIESFGSFVVQGDFIVGVIIFCIIAVVNFLVITKGASRVAEVSARFMLDALPGKQLAIDSDLRAGTISKEEASLMREQLGRDAKFYGAMDGAMKFVQGDAIAGLIITFVNAIGGVSIGISRGLSPRDAVDTFGVLTIGDGLVSIIPSLLISVCAGIVVTRVSVRVGQATSASQIVSIASIVLLCIGLLPGFPVLPFFIVSASLIAWVLLNEKHSLIPTMLDEAGGKHKSLPKAASSVHEIPHLSALRLELSSKLFSDFNEFNFNKKYKELQKNIYQKRGVMLPDVLVAKNPKLDDWWYIVNVREQSVRKNKAPSSCVFVSAPSSLLDIFRLKSHELVKHPLECSRCAWVSKNELGLHALERLGIDIYSTDEFLALEVVGASLDVVEEIIGLSEIKALIESVKVEHSALVDEVFNAQVLSYSEFTDVVKRLISEQVNVRDLKLILEGVSQFVSANPDSEHRSSLLTELHAYLRMVLSRSIVSEALSPGGNLRVFVLSSDVENEFKEVALISNIHSKSPPLDPVFYNTLRDAANTLFTPVLERGIVPVVLLCSSEIRLVVQQFFSGQLFDGSWFRTISYSELNKYNQPETIGVLSLQ